MSLVMRCSDHPLYTGVGAPIRRGKEVCPSCAALHSMVAEWTKQVATQVAA